jgi:8-amino-7-oxononanoate synthase
MMGSDAYAWIDQAMQTIHRAGWYRSAQTIASLPGPTLTLDGQTLLNFASNDYLGLAGDPRLIAAAVEAARTYGTGSTGSRLITGQRPLHRELEQALAQLKQTADALVFSSGYLANLGTIAALVGQRDLVLGDAYNHSSLRSGAKVSGADRRDYAHCDLTDLRSQLEQHRHCYRRCLILSDSVFSMDGDLAPLPGLLDLAEEFDCMVLVDEAHATGVMGPSGAGGIEQLGSTGRPVVQMGTLSKALGSLGGYVAGSAAVIDFLRNRAPSWIYTTGLSPADTAAALAAVRIVQTEPERRERLGQNVAQFQQGILRMPEPAFKLLPSDAAIFCLALPDVETAMRAAGELRSANIFALAIRPPTVPTSRLRITLMATHTAPQIDHLLQALADLGG